MVWKCPPLHLPNWNHLWKWKEDMKEVLHRPPLDKEKFESNWDLIFNKKPKPPTGGFLTTEEHEQTTIPKSTTNNETNLQQTNG